MLKMEMNKIQAYKKKSSASVKSDFFLEKKLNQIFFLEKTNTIDKCGQSK